MIQIPRRTVSHQCPRRTGQRVRADRWPCRDGRPRPGPLRIDKRHVLLPRRGRARMRDAKETRRGHRELQRKRGGRRTGRRRARRRRRRRTGLRRRRRRRRRARRWRWRVQRVCGERANGQRWRQCPNVTTARVGSGIRFKQIASDSPLLGSSQCRGARNNKTVGIRANRACQIVCRHLILKRRRIQSIRKRNARPIRGRLFYAKKCKAAWGNRNAWHRSICRSNVNANFVVKAVGRVSAR